MRIARPKVFYGWWVALTAALGLFLNTATIIVFSFGLFAKAMGQEFHAGRARISLAFTIHNLTSALCIPLAVVEVHMATVCFLLCLGCRLWWRRGDAIHGCSIALV